MHFKYASLFSLLPLVSSHFLLNYPDTIGFSDDDEGEYPCGSFDVLSRDKVTDFTVGGFPIALTSTHPGATWFIRAALLNDTEAWVDLLPAIIQAGQGDFCTTGVPAPAAWVGKDGVIQIIEDAVDGFLFQCAAVKFVSGSTTTNPSSCKNVTRLEAEYSNEEIILNASTTSIITAPTGSATPTGAARDDDDDQTSTTGTSAPTSAPTSTSSAPTGSTTPNAANRNGIVGGIVLGAAGVIAGLLL